MIWHGFGKYWGPWFAGLVSSNRGRAVWAQGRLVENLRRLGFPFEEAVALAAGE